MGFLKFITRLISPVKKRVFIFSDEFLRVFNLPGKLPVDGDMLERLREYSEDDMLDETFSPG